MQLIEIKNKNKLNDFVSAQEHAEFLQSWEWGEFQEKVEGKVIRIGVEENGELIAAATLVKKSLPGDRVRRSLGVGGINYFYCPRGPIINFQSSIFNLQFFLDEIKKIADKEDAIFLRFEPKQIEIRNTKYEIRKSLDIQPSKTIVLDLSKSEEELLSAMHQKTRYNIRLAEKKGVKISEAPGNSFEEFWNLMKKTSGRDGFTSHDKDYYEKLLQTAPENFKLFFAFVRHSLGESGDKYEDKILCAGIFAFFGDTATYLFGASSDENREVMAPYLLQWELIRRAKAGGYKFYDFFGIDEKKWPGVTRFKRGFGGQEINYPGTFDVVYNRINYGIYRILRTARRLAKF
ncbi:MAG: peptidoglycan bridge formation glycyltransferase FemA/FemB family protein [Patescibacteria group bacterium]|nr:peptidoglycan bridge formation glycyltransferase FemA/FemB family protein [Patescibacteria group bacterium]